MWCNFSTIMWFTAHKIWNIFICKDLPWLVQPQFSAGFSNSLELDITSTDSESVHGMMVTTRCQNIFSVFSALYIYIYIYIYQIISTTKELVPPYYNFMGLQLWFIFYQKATSIYKNRPKGKCCRSRSDKFIRCLLQKPAVAMFSNHFWRHIQMTSMRHIPA